VFPLEVIIKNNILAENLTMAITSVTFLLAVVPLGLFVYRKVDLTQFGVTITEHGAYVARQHLSFQKALESQNSGGL